MLKIILPLLFLFFLPPSIKKYRWFSSLLGLILIIILNLNFILTPNISPFSFSSFLSLDLIRASLIILSIWIRLLIIIARSKISQNNLHPNLFLSTVIVLTIILILCFSRNNIIIFYILFEASLLPTLFLILMWGYQPERLQAGIYLILYTVTASLPLLLGLLIINFHNLSSSIISNIWQIPDSINSIPILWWLIIIIAFLVKIPIFILHLWLPKAHVEAPVAGSIILAGILLKLGSYGILRLIRISPIIPKLISTCIVRVSLWGALITRIICIRQPDLKALIAYSSVGHMGLLTAGIITYSNFGWKGALIIIIAHGLCSSALFSLANITYEHSNSRSIFLTKGLLSVAPIISIWWFILAAANIAAPPSINLLGEIFLLTRIISKSIFYILIIASVRFISAAYSLHLYANSQHGHLPQFSNPTAPLFLTNYNTLLFHTVPLIIIILKAPLIYSWF